MVSIHKFRVYKAVSRHRVNKSLERDFIKMILTKNQGKSKKNKEWIRIEKSRCVELNWTCYCIKKFNAAFSLCGDLGIALYFSKGYLKVVAKALQPLEETVVCFLGQKSSL